jgi:hypothetical protein
MLFFCDAAYPKQLAIIASFGNFVRYTISLPVQ